MTEPTLMLNKGIYIKKKALTEGTFAFTLDQFHRYKDGRKGKGAVNAAFSSLKVEAL